MRIHILAPEEARRIAAGEVIDRPAAIVRECIDNALDAGATRIDVLIEGAGSARVEVRDNGCGMDSEDMLLCYQNHATSKISTLADLDTAVSLGFRGEALAATAAVARLEIISSMSGGEAWHLCVENMHKLFLETSQRTQGTTVSASGIFDSIPARKRFLKKGNAEFTMCRAVFVDKALAFPNIAFSLSLNGAAKLTVPPHASLHERFAFLLLNPEERGFLRTTEAAGVGFSLIIVVGGPELSSATRRNQYIFANGRRINSPALLQALEYGMQGWFPGGTHPIGALFITVDPALADFNVHPSKREARFVHEAALHHAVTEALRGLVQKPAPVRSIVLPQSYAGAAWHRKDDPKKKASWAQFAQYMRETSQKQDWYVADSQDNAERTLFPPEQKIKKQADIYYKGQIFGLFFLIERGDSLFIIDQHAAHERAIYETLRTQAIKSQELLVSIPLPSNHDEDSDFLSTYQQNLETLGISISCEHGQWFVNALPEQWHKSDSDTVADILNLRTAKENITERWLATVACHRAIKDGEYLSESLALDLARTVLDLPSPRCPHGRPLWLEIPRNDMLHAVQRP
ncbi:putative DNA mismatch repair protein MutL [Pillotina sp. SPG140]|jgi:DNA mismatch repair protein MutL